MGQITNPIVKGITVLPVDRQSGPGAGGGATGNDTVFLGANAGKNSAISNFVALGNGAGGSTITDVTLNGSVLVGVGNTQALNTGDTVANHPVTVVGSNNLSSTTRAGAVVALGSNLYTAYNQILSDMVLIGNNILPLATTVGLNSNCVLIGFDIGSAAVSTATHASVMIGTQINNGQSPANTDSSIVIGTNVSGWTNMSTMVAIGVGILMNGTQPGSSVLIGNNIASTGQNNGDDRNVCIGAGAVVSGSQNVVIGDQASSRAANGTSVVGNVCIGAGAGTDLVAASVGQLAIGEFTAAALGGTLLYLLYGDFTKGNLVIGNSTVGVNRDFGAVAATNALKLINGTKGSTGPSGGGYFYASAGQVHWVDGGNNDTILSAPNGGQIGSVSGIALTNNAAAQVATITNGPLVGNPTKWAPFNDNGTIRNIPMW